MIDDASRTVPCPEDRSSRELLGATISHAKAYLIAEKRALVLRASLSVGIVKSVAIFGIGAVVLGLFGFGWILTGCVGALAHLVGPIWAALIIGAILLLLALYCLKKMSWYLSSLSGLGR